MLTGVTNVLLVLDLFLCSSVLPRYHTAWPEDRLDSVPEKRNVLVKMAGLTVFKGFMARSNRARA